MNPHPQKEYGLIQRKKSQSQLQQTQFARLSAFNCDSSDSDDDNSKATALSKKVNISLGETQKRQIKKAQDSALNEDPTIFQYDELYDDIQSKRQQVKAKASMEKTQGPKYIKRLLASADVRKKEYERRIERQVQKDREAEGEEFKDKESFVTSSYRAKLEEMKLIDEAEKRSDYLESIGDVTKQRDLGGFYRHLWEQKMGDKDEPNKTTIESEKLQTNDKQDGDEINTEITTTNQLKPQINKKERVYRKRKSDNEQSDDDESKKSKNSTDPANDGNLKKSHIQSNLDADSDFSIDSSDSDSGSDNEKDNDESNNQNQEKKEKKLLNVDKKVKIGDDKLTAGDKGIDGGNNKSKDDERGISSNVKSNSPKETSKKSDENKYPNEKEEEEEVKKIANPIKPKIDIWKKRTVGPVLEAALQRYYERKVNRQIN